MPGRKTAPSNRPPAATAPEVRKARRLSAAGVAGVAGPLLSFGGEASPLLSSAGAAPVLLGAQAGISLRFGTGFMDVLISKNELCDNLGPGGPGVATTSPLHG